MGESESKTETQTKSSGQLEKLFRLVIGLGPRRDSRGASSDGPKKKRTIEANEDGRDHRGEGEGDGEGCRSFMRAVDGTAWPRESRRPPTTGALDGGWKMGRFQERREASHETKGRTRNTPRSSSRDSL